MPAFFGLLFLLQRRFRAAAVSAVTFLVSIVAGSVLVPGSFGKWWATIFDVERFGGVDNPTSQSLRLWLAREAGIDGGPLWFLLALATTALALTSAYFLLKAGRITAALSIVGIGMCLVSPFSWHHYWLWIVPLAVTGVADLICWVSNDSSAFARSSLTRSPVTQFAVGALAPLVAVALLWPFVSVVLGFPFDIWGQINSGNVVGRSAWILWSLAILAAPTAIHLVASRRSCTPSERVPE